MCPERRFLFRLALALGKTVRELQRELSSHEVAEWIAYYSLEPFGALRDDWHHANLAALFASLWGDGKRRHKVGDFLCFPEEQRKRRIQTAQEQQRVAKLITRTMGGIVPDG